MPLIDLFQINIMYGSPRNNQERQATVVIFVKRHSNEPHHEKTNILVFDLVRHKPGYAVTEDG